MQMKKRCPRCQLVKNIDEFYTRRGKQTHSYCKQCVNSQTTERQRELKRLCIEYKGKVCHDCGGVFHQACYDFHHLDPSEKDFSLGKRKTLKFSDEVRKELDKCVLLCANCHRLRHAKF